MSCFRNHKLLSSWQSFRSTICLFIVKNSLTSVHIWRVRRLSFSSEWGVPNIQKVGINKVATPLFQWQKFNDSPLPPPPFTLPPKQTKLVLKSVLLNKISTLSMSGLSTCSPRAACGQRGNFVCPVKSMFTYMNDKWNQNIVHYDILVNYLLRSLLWWSLTVWILQKTPLILAPCGPPYNPADRCAAHGGFELEIPDLCHLVSPCILIIPFFYPHPPYFASQNFMNY